MSRCENGCVARKWPDFGRAPNFPKITKAGDEPIKPSDYEWLLAIADKVKGKVRAAFLNLIEQMRNEADMQALRDALQSGDITRAMSALGMGDNFPSRLSTAIKPPLEDVFIEAGRAAGDRGVQTTTGQISFGFDVSNPHAVDFLKNYDMDLIREISDETRAAVKQVVLDAFQQGGHPYQQAKTIRQIVGLTKRQAKAVTNFRAARVAENRPAAQVDRMVAKYEQKQLRLRAENIARTETMRASNAGQDAAWNQAADKGLINRATFKRRWLVTPDDRLCVLCAAVPALNPDGRKLGEPFITPVGPLMYPSVHPQDRCILVAMPF